MSLVNSGASWLRQSIAWSNSRASWRERISLVLFLAVAVGLSFLTAWLTLWPAILLWASYFLALAVCSRQGWVQLFGPVLFYDMIRTARQSRYVVVRLIYAGLLLFVLCFIYLNVAARHHRDMDRFFVHVGVVLGLLVVQIGLVAWLRIVTLPHLRLALAAVIAAIFLFGLAYVVFLALSDDRDLTPRETALVAEAYFGVFMVVQLLMLALLTPSYVAGAIADEKERKTLEFMLATDLSNHEIVLSKLLSRLANMTLFLLTGLPILSILQFLGGVDTELMLVGFAATGLTMLGVASLGILFSTLFKRSRDAIGMTYLSLIAYATLGMAGKIMSVNGVPWTRATLWEADDAPTWADVSDWINIGNPLAAMVDVEIAIQRAGLGAALPTLLTWYAWFHGVLALVCIVWSIARLRTVALKQTVAGKTQKLPWWDTYRPAIGDLPMLWKELHIENRLKFNWVAWGVVILLALLTFGSGLLVLGAYFWDLFIRGNLFWNLAEEINTWFRVAGTGVALLMALMVAVRASTCISGERERDTFDALLTTPMSAESMLAAKLVGCLTSLRVGWIWFGAMVALAVFTGGLHPFAVPIVIVAWAVYALFFTMVGLWYSMACQTSMRATVLTVLTVLFVGGGHWLLMGLCFYFPAAMLMRGRSEFIEYVLMFEAGVTPPFVLAFCSFSWDDLVRDFGRRESGKLFAFSVFGVFLWGAGCVFMWYGLLVPKFRAITRREELTYQ